MNHYPDNRPSHFFTKLPQTVTLDGDFEIGLSEIHINHLPYNIDVNEVKFAYKDPGEVTEHTFSVPNDRYRRNTDMFNKLGQLCHQLKTKYDDQQDRVVFGFNTITERVTIMIYKENGELSLSERMAEILGFRRKDFVSRRRVHRFEGDFPMSLKPAFKSVYLYCDIVTPRPVGDFMVPLLRTLPAERLKNRDVHIVYEKPHYIPLIRPQFNSLEILITSEKGKEISFDNGHVIVTLHLRRRRPDY